MSRGHRLGAYIVDEPDAITVTPEHITIEALELAKQHTLHALLNMGAEFELER